MKRTMTVAVVTAVMLLTAHGAWADLKPGYTGCVDFMVVGVPWEDCGPVLAPTETKSVIPFPVPHGPPALIPPSIPPQVLPPVRPPSPPPKHINVPSIWKGVK